MPEAGPCGTAELRALIESALEELPTAGVVAAAARYAVFSGGKRIRPLLTLLAAQASGAETGEALRAACAVEYLHCASLIWDDMPAMDNASERRGGPAVHVRFGEAVATLAALALMNRAYAIFARNARLAAEAENCVAAMIEGQASGDHRKTAGLMRLTLMAGAMAAGRPRADAMTLGRCGELIGEAYQIFDDFRDGDAGSAAGAEDAMAEAKTILRRHFGPRAAGLIESVEAVANHCAGRRLAAA